MTEQAHGVQPQKTKYCLGFAFDTTGDRVLLIRKNRPAWQAGKLNGVGGHVEPGESFIQAQVREFLEETGIITDPDHWNHFATLHGPRFEMHVFSMFSEAVSQAKSLTDEPVAIYFSRSQWSYQVSNLTWLISAALDVRENGGDLMLTGEYKG